MKEIRFHGRGGQGVVLGSEVLADAAVREGRYAQAFPTFGPERRGAPVTAFTRIDNKPIRLRCQIYQPDYVVILDSSVCGLQDVTSGLKKDGVVVVNTPYTPEEVREKGLIIRGKIYTIDATSIALKILGRPILNTVILGAFAAATGEVKLESIYAAIKERFPKSIAERNAQAIEEAYKTLKR
jgi:2-oxoacid:acceptor oxidoreductase gamma subunit (pyruvate/2-ketoisovalerate family)